MGRRKINTLHGYLREQLDIMEGLADEIKRLRDAGTDESMQQAIRLAKVLGGLSEQARNMNNELRAA